ncbi:hypothetical protein N8206_03465 [Planktomarina temperata]|nr:hypothetical protein [Planktomarina temperata]
MAMENLSHAHGVLPSASHALFALCAGQASDFILISAVLFAKIDTLQELEAFKKTIDHTRRRDRRIWLSVLGLPYVLFRNLQK